MTQKIKEIVTDPDTVLVFDIDGTLAKYEFGDRNHNACPDSRWQEYIRNNKPYESIGTAEIFRPIIQGKPDHIFVCSIVGGIDEINQKTEFLKKNFPEIPASNIYFVGTEDDKLISLFVIQNQFENKPAEDVFMIDDSCSVLNCIQKKSDFGTIHISSFLD